MSLKEKINQDIKTAMKAKDKVSLEALRSVKSEILNAETAKKDANFDEKAEVKLLQKLVKQRKESAELYREQGRDELAAVEENQAAVIEKYLPKQMDEAEVEKIIQEIIDTSGANSPSDMGKVMGQAVKKLGGKADGKTISSIAKKLLS